MTGAGDHPRSAPYDLLVQGGTVLLDETAQRADVAVSGGKIAALLRPGTAAAAGQVLDAAGRWVLPGLIDSHVHFRTPGLTSKEDWACGSRAAVAGGVTTVIDMPNTDPPLFTPRDAHHRHGLIDGTSLVDYRFHGGADPARPAAIADFTPREATSVKVFLAGHHTAPHVVRDLATLETLFTTAAARGLRLLFHAEDDRVFTLLDAWQGPPAGPADYEPRRPRTGAIVAVARLIELARRHGTAIHVLHVSSQEEADLLTAAAAAGLPVTFEITGHHLTFTEHDTRGAGARLRLSPALRRPDDRDRLWQALVSAQAATSGSDHAPHEPGLKLLPPADAPPGLPGVQELLPALHTGLRQRCPQLPEEAILGVITRVLAREPARLFQLDARKGRIAPGYDADLAIFDPDAAWTLDPPLVQSKCGWSAYQGRMFTGQVETTLRRGRVVYRRDAPGGPAFGAPDGEWLAPAPAGR